MAYATAARSGAARQALPARQQLAAVPAMTQNPKSLERSGPTAVTLRTGGCAAAVLLVAHPVQLLVCQGVPAVQYRHLTPLLALT